MEKTLKQVFLIIDLLRLELLRIAENKSFNDPEIVSASRMLDVVLNEYDRLLKEKTAHQ